MGLKCRGEKGAQHPWLSYITTTWKMDQISVFFRLLLTSIRNWADIMGEDVRGGDELTHMYTFYWHFIQQVKDFIADELWEFYFVIQLI